MNATTPHDAAMAAPPAGVVGMYFAGIPLESWVLYLNLIYIVVALVWKLRSIYMEHKNERCK